jgi:hypothetical protein
LKFFYASIFLFFLDLQQISNTGICLLVDNRENFSKKVRLLYKFLYSEKVIVVFCYSKDRRCILEELQRRGVECVPRALPLGDFTWIAQVNEGMKKVLSCSMLFLLVCRRVHARLHYREEAYGRPGCQHFRQSLHRAAGNLHFILSFCALVSSLFRAVWRRVGFPMWFTSWKTTGGWKLRSCQPPVLEKRWSSAAFSGALHRCYTPLFLKRRAWKSNFTLHRTKNIQETIEYLVTVHHKLHEYLTVLQPVLPSLFDLYHCYLS